MYLVPIQMYSVPKPPRPPYTNIAAILSISCMYLLLKNRKIKCR